MDILNNKDKKTKLRESVLKIKEKYPDRVPIFVLRSKHDKVLPNINMNKFVVPSQLTVGELMNVVRKRIDLGQEISMFFFIEEKILICNTDSIGELYDKHKNEDGLLLMYYCGENTFGNNQDN
jgi:GABA(A) receptor-associated protein